jgi:hypothetical protein
LLVVSLAAGLLLLLGVNRTWPAPAQERADAQDADPKPFPTPLSPDLPFDVDVEALSRLDRDKQIPEAQRLFDIFAWQMFIALNWPADRDGAPDKSKSMNDNTSKRVWMGWRRNDSVFLPTGEKPAPWEPRKALQEQQYTFGASVRC